MRAYTMTEIDQMREDLTLTLSLSDLGHSYYKSLEEVEEVCEDRLRTYMTGSVDPQDIHDRAVKAVQEFESKGGKLIGGVS